MPIEIDCPKCSGDQEIKDDESGLWIDCGPCDGTGKIKLYTQEELDKAVKDEREAITGMIIEYSVDDIYTIAELLTLIRKRGEG